MLKKSFFFLFVLLICSQSGLSAMLTEIEYFGGSPNLKGSLTFNQFNNFEDNLVSISMLLCVQTYDGMLILDNDGRTAVSGTLQFGAKGNISSTDVILLNSSYMPALKTCSAVCEEPFNLSADNGDGLLNFDSTTPDGLTCLPSDLMDSESGFIGQNFWSMGRKGFLGTGTFKINYSITQWVDFGSFGSMTYGVSPVNTAGFVMLIYNYNPAPEPATILFFGIAALIFRKPQMAAKAGITVK
ncbi:MAG: hypothetical protein ABFD79_04330 [Phycisphaerales bacterium]